jgi:GPH family glycoside/pentoside/hexuronide:cation symporter
MTAGNKDNDVDDDGRLSWRVLLGYGGLALPVAALNLPLYVYLPTFYSAELGLDLAVVGSVLLLARLLDTVIDPVMGELSDRLRTPFGQRRPWLALATPLLLFASWKLFVPAGKVDALYLLTWRCVGYIAWTLMLLAYAAWGAELSAHYHERSRVTSVREGFVILGILLAASLPAAAGVAPESREALALMFWLMLACLPAALTALLLTVRERPAGHQAALPFLAGMRLAFANAPFRRLIAAFFLNGVANGLPATLFILFVQHVIGAATSTGWLLLLYFASSMLAVPFWLKLSYRLGKHRAWSLAMLWACLVFAWVPLLGEGDVLAFALICVLSGASLGADLALPASMQADVVDLDRAVSGRRRTAFFFALWSMASKLALALAVGIAFPALSALGFSTMGTNPPGALAGLALLYGAAPVAIKLAAISLIWRFELDAVRQKTLRAEIETTTGAV